MGRALLIVAAVAASVFVAQVIAALGVLAALAVAASKDRDALTAEPPGL